MSNPQLELLISERLPDISQEVVKLLCNSKYRKVCNTAAHEVTKEDLEMVVNSTSEHQAAARGVFDLIYCSNPETV